MKDEIPAAFKGITFTAPCLGAVGSQPFLDDIERQLAENRSAEIEGRDPEVLPIQCRLCGGFHVENQTDPMTAFRGTQFEEYANNRIGPKTPEPEPPDPELVAAAVEAVSVTPEETEFETEEEETESEDAV